MPIPTSLRTAIERGKVIPFAGAGVSLAVRRENREALLPSWTGLLEAAADKLKADGKADDAAFVRQFVGRGRYLEAAKEAKGMLGPEWTDFLKSQIQFDSKDLDPDTLALPRLLWRLAHPLVVTTNYDRILLQVHPAPGSVNVIDIQAPAEQSALLQGTETTPTLWHLHGQIGNAADLVLTPDGYTRLYGSGTAESQFSTALAALQTHLRTHTVLFVGFSFADPALGAELRAFDELMQGHGGPHYALVHAGEVDRVNALDLPITAIPYEDHGEPLLEVLRELVAVREDAQSAAAPQPAAADAPESDAAPAVATFSPKLPVFNVPYREKGAEMVGREEKLQAVRDQLMQGTRTRIGHAASFRGLGGLGKTQLAVEYAYRFRDQYPGGVVWLTADQEIPAQLAILAEEAGWVSPQSEHKYKVDIAAQRIRTFDGGLVVFDNTDAYTAIEPYLPSAQHSPHLLLTSRVVIKDFYRIELDPLGAADSLALLLQEAGRPDPQGTERQHAERIAVRLDGLPLALEIAGAYLRNRSGISFQEYEHLLDTSFADAFPEKTFSSFTGHDADLAKALAVHETLVRDTPALVDVLRLLTWSASAPMSRDLLATALTQHGDADLADALALGVELRLLKKNDAPARYEIHRLVAQVRQTASEPDAAYLIAHARRIADWFVEHKEDIGDLEDFERDMDHLDAWRARLLPIDSDLAAELLWLQAYPPYHRGQYKAAYERVKEAQAARGGARGDDEFAAHLLTDLGATLDGLGRHEDALGAEQQALGIRRDVLGPDHPNTARSLDSIGVTLSHLGRHEEALGLSQQALGIHRDVLGPDHPNTASSLDSVGAALSHLGRHEEALGLSQQALGIRRDVLGPDHPVIASSLDSVGVSLANLRRYREASDCLSEAKRIHEAALGADHPFSIHILIHLAQLRAIRGGAAKAKQMLRATQKRVGRDHPSFHELRVALKAL